MSLSSLKYIFKKNNVLPIHLIFHVTYKCNSKCKSCFVPINQNLHLELELEEIKKIADNFKDLLWIQLGGGEPFLHQNLVEIASYFNAPYISIPTNATMPSIVVQKTKLILDNVHPKLLHISISLDNLGDKHDEFRGFRNNFVKLQETAKLLMELKKDYDNLSVSVNTVISKENENDIQNIGDWVYENIKPDHHSFEFLRGSPADPLLSLPDREKQEELIKIVKNILKKYQFYHGLGIAKKFIQASKYYTQEVVERVTLDNKRQISCTAGRLSAYIDAHGNVYPCEILQSKRLGNLKDVNFDFKKIWFNPDHDKLKEFIKNECFCTHSCFMLPSIIFNATNYPSIIKSFLNMRQ